MTENNDSGSNDFFINVAEKYEENSEDSGEESEGSSEGLAGNVYL